MASDISPWFEATPQIISALAQLAWPIAIFAIAFLYRKQIRELLSRIKSANLFGNAVEFAVETIQGATEDIKARAAGEEADPKIHMSGPLPDFSRKLEDSTFHLTLYEEPRDAATIAALKAAIRDNPFIGLMSVSVQIERNLRDMLAARVGRAALEIPGVQSLAKQASQECGLGQPFYDAIREFISVRDRLAHYQADEQTRDQTRLIAEAGLELLETLQRIPRSEMFVTFAGLPVYLDAACAILADDLEGLEIAFAATPGATGDIRIMATQRKRYYQPGNRVTPNWKPDEKKRSQLWVKAPESCGFREVATLGGVKLFEGERY